MNLIKLKLQIIHIFFLTITIISCSSTNENTSIKKDGKIWDLSEYKFVIEKDEVSYNKLKSKISFPQYENMYYYIVDVNGNKISNSKFEDVNLDPVHPFYWAKTDGYYYLYTYPHEKVISDPFSKPVGISLSKSSFNISNANKDFLSLYRIQIPKSTQSKAKRYFFTIKSKNVENSKFYDLETAFNKCASKRHDVIGSKPYHILITNDNNCQYVIVDQNMNPIINDKFDYLKASTNNKRYVIATKDSLSGIVDIRNKTFSGYKYKLNKEVYPEPFIYNDFDPYGDSDQLVGYYNATGNKIFEVRNSKLESSKHGIVRYWEEGQKSYFDLARGIEVEIPNNIQSSEVKHVYRQDKKVIIVTKNNKQYLTSGQEYYSQWQFDSKITDSIKNTISKMYPEKERIVVSEKFNRREYRFVQVDEFRTILDGNSEFLFPLDSVQVLQQIPPYFGQQQITIQSLESKEKLLLDNDLNVIYFPERPYSTFIKMEEVVLPEYIHMLNNRLLKKYPIQGFLFYGGNEMTHVFRTNGQYVSSHKGTIIGMVTPYRLTGYCNKDIAYLPFAEIEHPRSSSYKSKVYYVRLTDGLEYHKYD